MDRRLPIASAIAALACGVALVAPAAAQPADRTGSGEAAPRPGWERQAERYRSFGDRSDAVGAVVERYSREQFERGYRAGREAERRRAAQAAGAEEGPGRTGPEPAQGADRYLVIPDILPDTPRYRGMQDFALMPDRSTSMDWLLTAAQSLREAVQAMAQQPPGERRDRAMERAREALLETQQAMAQLPPDLRTR